MYEALDLSIKKLTILKVEYALLKAKESGQIIPDVVFEIIKEVKDNLK